MKNIFKLLIGIVIIASLLLSACAPPPPPVTKVQLTDAEAQAVAAEKEADTLNAEMKDLEQQVAAKNAELKELKEYKNQLEAE